MPEIVPLSSDYSAWLAELKSLVHTAQQRATLAVNHELVLRYWQIGRHIYGNGRTARAGAPRPSNTTGRTIRPTIEPRR